MIVYAWYVCGKQMEILVYKILIHCQKNPTNFNVLSPFPVTTFSTPWESQAFHLSNKNELTYNDIWQYTSFALGHGLSSDLLKIPRDIVYVAG